jgi:hypothetical protein
MKRTILAAVAAIALAGAAAGAAAAAVAVDIHVGIATAPIRFGHAPRVMVVPNSDVYYYYGAPQYDVYRYGRFWYVNRGGVWFRARSHRGPFVSIAFARVPRAIVVLPARYHRHPIRGDHRHGRGWGNDERWRDRSGDRWDDRDRDRDRDWDRNGDDRDGRDRRRS